MGYVQLLNLQESIVLSDAVIAATVGEHSISSSAYTLNWSFIRLTELYHNCAIRVKHQMRTISGGGYSQIYYNGDRKSVV